MPRHRPRKGTKQTQRHAKRNQGFPNASEKFRISFSVTDRTSEWKIRKDAEGLKSPGPTPSRNYPHTARCPTAAGHTLFSARFECPQRTSSRRDCPLDQSASPPIVQRIQVIQNTCSGLAVMELRETLVTDLWETSVSDV